MPSLYYLHHCPTWHITPSSIKTVTIVSWTSIVNLSRQYHHSAPLHTFASDGSCFATAPNHVATNFAVVANENVFTASITTHGHETGILHGKVYGIVASYLLAYQSQLPSTIVYSNHLNSINFLNSHLLPHIIKTKAACSYYRWILDIWKDINNNQHQITLLHSKAHTNNTTLPAKLNWLTNHLATQSHHDILPPPTLPPPTLPPPTFTMDNYTLHSPFHDFIESNMFTFIDSLLATSASHSCSSHCLTTLWQHITTLTFLFKCIIFIFCCSTTLHSVCSQLDTSLTLSCCLPNGNQPWCCFGCHTIEDAHHIFIHCPQFCAFHDFAMTSLVSATNTSLDASLLDPANWQCQRTLCRYYCTLTYSILTSH